jgi:RNA polymerase sigma-70 factor (ECF subfamily)
VLSVDETNDDLLVTRSREGDPRALAELYRRHAPALLAYLERMLRERAEAEDVLQETYLRVFQGRGQYAGRGRFRSWLFTVATRIAYDRRRAQRRHAELSPAVLDAARRTPVEAPEHAVDHRDLLEVVESALAGLPPAYAQAFFLRVREDRSYSEMAAICGEPEGTLRSRVHHAMKRVQRIVGESGFTPPRDRPSKEREL